VVVKALVIAAALVLADIREARERQPEEPDPGRNLDGTAEQGLGQSFSQPLGRDPGWSRPAEPPPTPEETLEALMLAESEPPPAVPESTSISWEARVRRPEPPESKEVAPIAA
jgi:hypothetical protein